MGFPCERARHKIKLQRDKQGQQNNSGTAASTPTTPTNSGCIHPCTASLPSAQPSSDVNDNTANSKHLYDAFTSGQDLNYIGHVVLSRLSQFVNFSQCNTTAKVPPSPPSALTKQATQRAETTHLPPKLSAPHPPPPAASTTTNSHYVLRQSLCLYAASSVILALCYLTSPATATADTPHPMYVNISTLIVHNIFNPIMRESLSDLFGFDM